ncbi:MAG: hypothetical protein ACI8W7_000866 [Gammaproteobacteria bacterium]|jgi:hypothetical protein
MEPRDPYISLWLEMTRLRLKKVDLGVFRANVAMHEPNKWPYPIIEAFLQRSKPSGLLAFTGEQSDPQERDKRCEAAFFLGQIQLHGERQASAAHWFHKATVWCPHSCVEYIAARTELQALNDRATPPSVPAPRYRTTANVNARTGPGTEYRRVNLLPKGTLLNVDGIELGWYRVVGIGATPSYVRSDFVAAPSGQYCNAVSCPGPDLRH